MSPKALFLGLAVVACLIVFWLYEENIFVKLLAVLVVLGFAGIMLYLGRLGQV